MTSVKSLNSTKSIETTEEESEEEAIKVCLEDFSFLQVLGKGSFGKVRQICIASATIPHYQDYICRLLVKSHNVLK